MFRKLTIFAFSALVALATLAAATSPSAAGHRDRVHFGVGIGFGSGYVHFGTSPRPRYYSPRVRYHHARPYYRHHYRVPVYRHYRPPVVYHRPRVHYRYGGGSHVDWCYARYRSYRAWDNTFQPYHGPRRQCWSPYS